MGVGPSALSCAYYLAQAGCQVNVFGEEELPGGKLYERTAGNPSLNAAVMRDIQGIMAQGLRYEKWSNGQSEKSLAHILHRFDAVYLPGDDNDAFSDGLVAQFGDQWWERLDPVSAQMTDQPKFFTCREYSGNGASVVEAAASGCAAAMRIWDYLNRDLSS